MSTIVLEDWAPEDALEPEVSSSSSSSSSSSARAINLADYATAGNGTVIAPWTGWDTNLVLARPGLGTISVVHSTGAATVTGVGTAFLASAAIGDWVCSVTATGVAAGKISAIAGDLSLTVETWNGATLVAGVYRIFSPLAIYAPSGYYSFATEWQIGYPQLTLYGDGASTRFIHTGVGKAVSVIGDYTALASNSQLITLADFTVQGGATTTYDVYLEGLNHFVAYDIYAHVATTAGIGVKDCVIANFVNCRYSGNVELPATPAPTYAWWVSGVHTITMTGCSGENAAQGLHIVSADGGLVQGGTFEGDSAYGTFIEYQTSNITFNTVHFESNATADIFIEGAAWLVFNNCSSNGLLRLSRNIGAGANTTWCQFSGGRYNAVTIDASCFNNSFIGPMTYAESGGAMTDNAVGGNYFQQFQSRADGSYYPSQLTSFGLFSVRNRAADIPGLSTASGFGGAPTITAEVGSSPTSMTWTIQPSAGAGALGAMTFSFVPVLRSALYTVTYMLENGTGTWASTASCRLTARTASTFSIAWDNAGVALTNGQTYIIHFIVIGHQ